MAASDVKFATLQVSGTKWGDPPERALSQINIEIDADSCVLGKKPRVSSLGRVDN